MSVATLSYGTYVFSPIPQVGFRDQVARLGESKLGASMIERVVTVKGAVYGNTLAETQAKFWALQAAIAQSGKQLYWHDGTTAQINNVVVQPSGVQSPEEWGQYEQGYSLSFSYQPLSETHFNQFPAIPSYGAFTFNPTAGAAAWASGTSARAPNPTIGFELKANRETEFSTLFSTSTKVTLDGFLEAGNVADLQVARAAFIAAFAADATLTFGPFTQAVRVLSVSCPADMLVSRLKYSVVLTYDSAQAVTGIIKMSSTRRVQNVIRAVTHVIPFVDASEVNVQVLGRGVQNVALSGYCLADTIAHARAAAEAAIDAWLPADTNPNIPGYTLPYVETTRDVTEKAEEARVEWNISRLYPTPLVTGGVYAGAPIF